MTSLTVAPGIVSLIARISASLSGTASNTRCAETLPLKRVLGAGRASRIETSPLPTCAPSLAMPGSGRPVVLRLGRRHRGGEIVHRGRHLDPRHAVERGMMDLRHQRETARRQAGNIVEPLDDGELP